MRSTRSLLVAVSLSVHLALVLGLFIAGFWRLDRLDAPRRTIDLAVAPPPPPAPAGGPATSEHAPFKKKQAKQVAKQLTQPVATEPATPATALPTTGDGTGSGGTGSGDDPEGTGACDAPPCGPGEPEKVAPPPPEPVVERAPLNVVPTVLRAMRTRGQTQIQPPDLEKTQLLRSGTSRATTTVKACVGANGAILSVAIVRGSQLPGWDAAILSAMRRWEYRPHQIDGRAVAVCGMVTFVYEIR